MSHLLVLFGPKRGIRIELGASLVAGRGADVGLQLVDPKVSREHCRFTQDAHGTRVEDLKSQNGTFVNGARLDGPHLLAAGDEIAVGDSLLVFDGRWEVMAARYDDVAVLVGDAAADAATVTSPAVTAASVSASVSMAKASTTADERLVVCLTDLGRALGAARTEEDAARVVLDALVRELRPARAFVLAKGPNGVRPLVGQSPDACVPISRSLLQRAEETGRAALVRDASTDRALASALSVSRQELRAVLVAPLFDGGTIAGFLHCDRPQPPYEEADALRLEALASVVSARGLVRASAPANTTPAPAPSPTKLGAVAPRAATSAPSAAFRAARSRAEAAARTPSTVLITGETGAGKEEMARFIHATSPRAQGPFVVVNAGAIPDALAESQLFGHERGAFTGAIATQLGLVEQADGGTLFLDEIGELGPALQVKLLRVLQEKAVQRLGAKVARQIDCRVLAATHRDLAAEVRAGRFRQDLYYRLNVIEVRLPPLRERREDLPMLAEALLARLAASLGRPPVGLTPQALAALAAPRWPGNIRELANVLERALVLRAPTLREPLEADEIVAAIGEAPLSAPADRVEGGSPTPPPQATPAAGAPSLALKIATLERAEIEAALRAARGVKARAAQELGMSRPTLDKKIAELGIDLWRDRDA